MSKYDLVGVESNAFNIMGYVTSALRKEGLSSLKEEYMEKAQQSDYNHLIAISAEYLEKANEKAIENGYIEEDEGEYDY